GRADLDGLAVGLPRHPVGQDRPVEAGRQPAADVAAVVAGAEDDHVGLVLTDQLGQRGGGGRTEEAVAGVEGVDGGGPVLAERAGHPLRVGAGVEALDGAGHLPGLGEEFEGHRRGLAGRVDLGEDPHLVESHGFSSLPSPQMTLSCSRKATIFSWASPSSSIFSPAWRSSAWRTSVISWRAPAQPTWLASRPRSATFSSSSGLFLAAMIPLKDGYRGSTTPAVTLTTAGSEASTSL